MIELVVKLRERVQRGTPRVLNVVVGLVAL